MRAYAKTQRNYSIQYATIREAQLDVHGDGRLRDDDKKPGIVGSRTRHLQRKFATLTEDGTYSETVLAKYDNEGHIVWRVGSIMDSRKAEPNGFPPSVEFYVQLQPVTSTYRSKPSDLPFEKSWDDISALSSSCLREDIFIFYRVRPFAYGKVRLLLLL